MKYVNRFNVEKLIKQNIKNPIKHSVEYNFKLLKKSLKTLATELNNTISGFFLLYIIAHMKV